MRSVIKCYSELTKLPTFKERFEYLKCNSKVGFEIHPRYRYQIEQFYRYNPKWKLARRKAIIRDAGCDLAVEGMEIKTLVIVHHINPLTVDDFMNDSDMLYDLENLITTSDSTHKAIHYAADVVNSGYFFQERYPGDTTLW